MDRGNQSDPTQRESAFSLINEHDQRLSQASITRRAAMMLPPGESFGRNEQPGPEPEDIEAESTAEPTVEVIEQVSGEETVPETESEQDELEDVRLRRESQCIIRGMWSSETGL